MPALTDEEGSGMPDKTYEMLFLNRDGSMNSQQQYTDFADALAAFRLFVEPESAELYSGITLMEHDWRSGRERIVAALSLEEGGDER